VMNLFLMPMWFLSGALFPVHNASAPLRAIMLLNPLTYGLSGLREALYLGRSAAPGAAGEIAVAYAATAGFAALLLVLAIAVARGRVAADLQ
jgi:ABC-2 type transport system permease protein